MKHRLLVIIIGFAIIALGTFAAVSQSVSPLPTDGGIASDSSDIQSPAEQESGRRALIVQRMNRGGTRIVTFIHNASIANENTYLAEADEVDVTAITVQNGNFSSGVAKRGGLTLAFSGTTYFISFDGYGNFHYTFPTPIPLREGDYINVNIPGGNIPGYTHVSLIGTPPATSSDEILVY